MIRKPALVRNEGLPHRELFATMFSEAGHEILGCECNPFHEDSQFGKLNILSFLSGAKTVSPIFVRIAYNKYIKIVDQDEKIPLEKIEFIKSKNIKYLYLLKNDFSKHASTESVATSYNLRPTSNSDLKAASRYDFSTAVLPSSKFLSISLSRFSSSISKPFRLFNF